MVENDRTPRPQPSLDALGVVPIGASVAAAAWSDALAVPGAVAPSPPARAFETELAAREAIIVMMRSLSGLGLNQGKSGNASLRWHRGLEPGLLLTPSGLPYDRLGPDDLVWMPLDQGRDDQSERGGTQDGLSLPPRFDGPHAPSSEWLIHLDLHNARPDALAVLHVHSPYATTLACSERVQREGVPPFHYMVAVAGGPDLRCAPYATFGTAELSVVTLAALEDRRACLMAHHGMVTVGAGLSQALDLAVEVESLCRIYWQALSIGEPPRLSDEEMARVLARFAVYGRVRSGRST